MNLAYIVIGVLLIINIYAFFMMGMDKKRAKLNKWRTPELKMIFTAILGGSIGIYLGMQIFHHKTKKRKFTIGIPAIFVIELLLILVIIKFWYIL